MFLTIHYSSLNHDFTQRTIPKTGNIAINSKRFARELSKTAHYPPFYTFTTLSRHYILSENNGNTVEVNKLKSLEVHSELLNAKSYEKCLFHITMSKIISMTAHTSRAKRNDSLEMSFLDHRRAGHRRRCRNNRWYLTHIGVLFYGYLGTVCSGYCERLVRVLKSLEKDNLYTWIFFNKKHLKENRTKFKRLTRSLLNCNRNFITILIFMKYLWIKKTIYF